MNYLEVIKNKSPRTVEQYDRHLKKFSEYLNEKLKNKDINVENINLDIAE
ncbi:MAG: site-specific integrase [Patescibacteria group bacterium]|nr:site-specific integrase [Patescibacteria group bacterium]